MSEKNICRICGESMPVGEEMFYFHGYSGPCPKPPLPVSRTACEGYKMIEIEEPHYIVSEDCMGGAHSYWRCWGKAVTGETVCGMGSSAEQAKRDAQEKAEKKSVIAISQAGNWIY